MAIRYKLSCPECDNHLEVETRNAGQDLNCESCNQPIVVPKLGDLRKLPQVEGSLPTRKRARSPLASWLFSGGLLLAVLALAAGGGLYYYAEAYLQYPVDFDQELQETNALIDDYESYKLWDTWQTEVKNMDLGEWREHPLIRYNKQSTILKNFAYGFFAAAGAGLLMVVGSMMVSKPK